MRVKNKSQMIFAGYILVSIFIFCFSNAYINWFGAGGVVAGLISCQLLLIFTWLIGLKLNSSFSILNKFLWKQSLLK
jgi:membrane protein implicated in regulation of membrane protease activity